MPRKLLADRIILCPSTHKLPAKGKFPLAIPFECGSVEVWSQRSVDCSTDDVRLFILKFGGTGGRGERATSHPADCWPSLPSEVWAINPPGYGSSTGPATLGRLVLAAEAVLSEMRGIADGRPILLTGNSLGAATVLHLAARHPVAGIMLRNPPPLRQLIVRRHGWWNLWLPAMAVARQVPTELDSIRNAAACQTPAIVITSGRDTIVPAWLQRSVVRAYAGEKKVLTIADGGHAAPIPEQQEREYLTHLEWLVGRMVGSVG